MLLTNSCLHHPDGRGELTPGGEYVFRDGRLMGRVDGRWVDWEVEEF